MSRADLDVEHLVDLLDLLPWERGGEDGEWQLPSAIVWDALDERQSELLTEAQTDYGSLQNGSRDDGSPSRIGAHLFEVFGGASAELVTAVGSLLAVALGVELSREALGRRWCDDVVSTSWRILVPGVAARHRLMRELSQQ